MERLPESTLTTIKVADTPYPRQLRDRLEELAPAQVAAIGDLTLLSLRKTALFCSTHCPGDPILAACDHAARWRDEGRCVISGFHSPVEKECLRILLGGKQPIIICPARSLEGMRIRALWRDGIAQGRLLLLSPFQPVARRQSAALARQRNDFVAALADEVYIPYASPNGEIERIARLVTTWGVPLIGCAPS
ncbi:MAG: hypothetical protein AMXMBFR4_17550 [Candidatus Hydrogenedentota bacterium]